jgi:UPF0755 protein
MKNNLKFIVLAIILMLLSGYFLYTVKINSSVNKNGDDIEFIITKGEGVKKIAKNLKRENLINSSLWFNLYVWQVKADKKIQAGSYILNPRYSIKQITEIFIKGDTVSQEKTIKIIEGWNLHDIGRYFENEGLFQAEEVYEAVGFPKIDYRINKDLPRPKNYSEEFPILSDKPEYLGLEGYLFPDTYRVFNDSGINDIIIKMLSNLENKIDDKMRLDIKEQGKSIFEIITMASIIEKEAKTEEDMNIVSGIFWNRINIGMPLQSDATLSYIYENKKAAHSVEETKIDSPYNSYILLGLPPGPISNPGLKAIKAAIYPEKTDYLFFLHSQSDGKTFFSKTYEEHLINKAKYLD